MDQPSNGIDRPDSVLSPQDIAAWPAYGGDPSETPRERARRLMRQLGLWSPGQAYGRRWGVGCVAVEVTQRCNLDCGLCYLSESSEAVKDLPLSEVLRRLDEVRRIYGEATDVQITGGDPTLRDHDELVTIVRHAATIGLRPALFTNGIRATRALLTRLADAGLVDVAFHVDTTQGRRGYASEAALNAVRETCIERARGLGLNIIFNTTLHGGNIHELGALAGYFLRRADVISFASFQLQADTGRGVMGRRPATLTLESVCAAIDAALRTRLSWDFPIGGHPACNRYACVLTAGDDAFDLFHDRPFMERMLAATADLRLDRRHRLRSVLALLRFWIEQPGLWAVGIGWLARLAWRMRRGLWRGRGRVGKISFFVHNFMDACHLERDRVQACVFMVATADGMHSMCLVNAQRDRFILPPVELGAGRQHLFWDPVTGATTEQASAVRPVPLSRKTAKGRARLRLAATRSASGDG